MSLKSKTESVFFCSSCGYESKKWMGQCPACGEWNTFSEEAVARVSSKASVGAAAHGNVKAVSLSEIQSDEEIRMDTGFTELSRVLGGGIVPGSLILVGGDPGIGKSTLLLQTAANMTAAGKKVIYISGEESLRQIKLRADRVGRDRKSVV